MGYGNEGLDRVNENAGHTRAILRVPDAKRFLEKPWNRERSSQAAITQIKSWLTDDERFDEIATDKWDRRVVLAEDMLPAETFSGIDAKGRPKPLSADELRSFPRNYVRRPMIPCIFVGDEPAREMTNSVVFITVVAG